MYRLSDTPVDPGRLSSVTWLLFWILMAAVTCFVVYRADKGASQRMKPTLRSLSLLALATTLSCHPFSQGGPVPIEGSQRRSRR